MAYSLAGGSRWRLQCTVHPFPRFLFYSISLPLSPSLSLNQSLTLTLPQTLCFSLLHCGTNMPKYRVVKETNNGGRVGKGRNGETSIELFQLGGRPVPSRIRTLKDYYLAQPRDPQASIIIAYTRYKLFTSDRRQLNATNY